MFKRTKVCAGLALAFGGSLALGSLPALAQQTQPAPQTLQRVEVTGSAIKRLDAEGPSPVEVITRKEIERTGATSVNELLKSISAVDIYDQGELASNSPSGSGTANVRLRGLAETDVLVLLNGRRLPVNALHDGSGAGAAVDINMIPVGAIQRIEILKDGASAIYGADAVAGVFNIITRSDYTGAEVYGQYGVSSRNDGKETRFGGTVGFGDLSKDKFNILLTVDKFDRDPILRKDRELSRSVDFRRFGGGDFRSSFSPYGNILDENFSFNGEQVRPCPPENFDAAASRCRYDFNASLLTAYNGADRLTALAIGTAQLTDTITLSAELMRSESKDFFQAHPVPDFFVLPDGRYYAGRFMQGGPRQTKRKSTLDYIAVGGTATVASSYDVSVNLGQGKSKVTNRDFNYYNADLWYPALAAGQIDATVDTNDPALVESLKVKPVRIGESKLTFLDTKVTGPLFKVGGGDVNFALGFSSWKEQLVDNPDELTQQGLVVGSIAQAPVDASRNAKAVFGELQIPILKNLEAQVAVRYDDYEKTGSQTSPKLALRYEPVQGLALRASYSESFKAPRLKQLFGATEEGAINITDRASCDIIGVPANQPCDLPAFETSGSNAELKPEKGKTFNVGIVFEPQPGWSVGLDYYKIKVRDKIAAPSITQAIEQGLWELDTTSTPPRYRVFTNLQNIAQSLNEGIDLDLRARFETGLLGTLSLRDSVTYQLKNRTIDGDEYSEYVGTYGTIPTPRWRNNFSVTAEKGDWATTVGITSTAGFRDSPLAMNEGALSARKVGSYHETNLNVTYTGIKGLSLTGGVQNLFDRTPPFSATNASDNQNTQMGFAELYSIRGRFFYVSTRYSF